MNTFKEFINEANSQEFKKKLPHKEYIYPGNNKVYVGEYVIDVFGYNQKQAADDLHQALLTSGFLEKHPLFRVKINTMDNYKPV